MKNNFQSVGQNEIQRQFKTNAYPYLFNGINDQTHPYGYETSIPKQSYLAQQQIESMRLNPLQNNY